MALTDQHTVGNLEVTVLRDGDLSFQAPVFPDAPPDEVEGLMLQAGLSNLPSAINAYLIRGSDSVTLVDCGPRDLMGPTAGRLPAALAEAGVAPDDIDRIIVTHLHGDHVAGAIDTHGQAVFKRAELLVHEADESHYSNDLNRARAAEKSRAGFDLARAVMSAYGDRLSVYNNHTDFGAGLTTLPLPGHTPGHSGLRLDSAGESFLLVADIVHCQLLQLPRPEWGVVFDVDPEQARATRERLLDQLATDHTVFSGSHFEDAPLGRIGRGSQGYVFEPL